MLRIQGQRKSWDRAQDSILLDCITNHGPRLWEELAVYIPGRTGKQCRERWINQLNPLIKKLSWSNEENWILYIQNRRQQNSWAKIANYLPGRTDNSIKNQWNVVFKNKLETPARQIEKYIKKCI